ncbi:hypothetical protein ACTA71_011288 [Dictyostelium dimigraforme]
MSLIGTGLSITFYSYLFLEEISKQNYKVTLVILSLSISTAAAADNNSRIISPKIKYIYSPLPNAKEFICLSINIVAIQQTTSTSTTTTTLMAAYNNNNNNHNNNNNNNNDNNNNNNNQQQHITITISTTSTLPLLVSNNGHCSFQLTFSFRLNYDCSRASLLPTADYKVSLISQMHRYLLVSNNNGNFIHTIKMIMVCTTTTKNFKIFSPSGWIERPYSCGW